MRAIFKLLAALVTALLCFTSAAAAVPYSLGSNATAANANTITMTTTANAAAGDAVVVWAQVVGGSISINSITDSVGGNTWVANTLLSGTSDRYRIFSTILTNPLPSGTTITVTVASSSTNFRAITAAGMTGVLAQDAIVTGTAGTTTNRSISIPSLASSYEIVFVGIAARSTITNPITEASGYALVSSLPIPGDNYAMQLSYRIVTSNVADTPSWSWSASVQNGMQATSFTLSGSPTARPTRSLLGVGQ